MSLAWRVAVLLCLIGIGAVLWVASYSGPPQPCVMGQKADKCK
ncbi:hypothetical protein [Taklimakanibacter albus]|nr:hypothetical protein [Aestuariivirga sp. YIM B02566]